MLSLPITFSSVLGIFAPVFSRPVWQHVKVLMTGAVLAPGKQTVTAMLQIMGGSAASDFQTYHRVLHRAVWSPLSASRLLRRLLVAVLADEETQWTTLTIDDWYGEGPGRSTSPRTPRCGITRASRRSPSVGC